MNIVVAFITESYDGYHETNDDIDKHEEIPEDGNCGEGKENSQFVKTTFLLHLHY